MIQVDVTHVGENCMKENVGCVILTKEITDILQTKEIKMTVKELIEKLNEFDENLHVYVDDKMGGGYPVSDMISVKEFTDGRKFVEIE